MGFDVDLAPFNVVLSVTNDFGSVCCVSDSLLVHDMPWWPLYMFVK